MGSQQEQHHGNDSDHEGAIHSELSAQAVQCHNITVNFLLKIPTIDTHVSPMREIYGVSFVNLNSNLCSASITTVLYTISFYIGLHYKGTQLQGSV